MKKAGMFLVFGIVLMLFQQTAVSDTSATPEVPSIPGVYALVGSNYVSMTTPAIDRSLGLSLFKPSPKFIISGKSASIQLDTNRPSFLIVLAQPEFTGKYDDPHTWDIVSANQNGKNRELPMKQGTKYSIGEADYLPTVEKISPVVYKLTVDTDLPAGEYFLLTGYNQKTKLATGYDFGIAKK